MLSLSNGGTPAIPAQATFKVQQDELVSLTPTLCQLVLRRKQLAQRVLQAYREAGQRVERGEATLPLSFQHADTIPELRFDPRSDPGGTIQDRVVILSCTLWDKRSWVLHHPDRFGEQTIRLARRGTYVYSDERNTRFVQFFGHAEDLLWCGDLVEHHLLRQLEPHKAHGEESIQRCQRARDLGFPRGCHSSRTGLLDTGDRWFAENTRNGELLVEPEALYRGILYGAALATLTLADGMGLSELQQVSADRWQNDGEPTTRVSLQALLPQGTRAQGERHLYRISPEAKLLLDEIARGLEDAHDGIPIVPPPHRTATLLQPERYLFQWQGDTVDPHEFALLIRFVLHGLRTAGGERVVIPTLRKSAALPGVPRDHELKRLRDSLLAPLASSLSPSTLKSYQQNLLAYLRFAGSAEQAYDPEALRRWIAHLLRERAYRLATINQMATPVRRSMTEAGRRGQLDQQRAAAFNNISVAPGKKPGPAPKTHRALGLSKPRTVGLTEEDRQWIAKQCHQDPAITASELREKLQTERGKRAGKVELNRVRASFGLQRAKSSPPRAVSQRPASYKLSDTDIDWLVQQRRENPTRSGPTLQVALWEQRGKQIGVRAINGILRKNGLSRRSAT